MNFWKHFLPLFLVLISSITGLSAEHIQSFESELNERDFDVLRQFVNSKRTLDVQEKSYNLTISGDVRTEWRYLYEQRLGHNIRGSGNWNERFFDKNSVPFSRNDFDIEANLRFDYIDANAWGVMHLMFDNSAGVDQGLPCFCEDRILCQQHHHHEHDRNHNDGHGGNVHDYTRLAQSQEIRRCDPCGWHGSGTRGEVNLRQAFLGYNLYADDSTRFDIELGRRHLYNIFDSRIQFLSRFDGMLFKLSEASPCVGDWYINLGAFVIDERVNHFGWVTEAGILNICDKGFDIKYSFIDWTKNGKNRCGVQNPAGFKFRNSQLTLAYHLMPDMFYLPGKLYGAVLINHDAHGYFHHDSNCEGGQCFNHFVNDNNGMFVNPNNGMFENHNNHAVLGCQGRRCSNKGLGWYAGITVGQICQQGDWAIDFIYQYVQANAIPDRDVSGIGRGNALNESFTAGLRGNTNYQGFRVEGLYAVTDNLTMDCLYQHSTAIDKHIGGPHRFSQFELEAIYAF